jgi:hypothetical protein
MNADPHRNKRPDRVFFFYQNGEKTMNNDSTRTIRSKGTAMVIPDE